MSASKRAKQTFEPVTVARIYCTEGDRQVEQLMHYLHDRAQVRGVTLFRGVAGFGLSGEIHTTSLLDLSAPLPVVIEFFDRPERIEQILTDLYPLLESGHVLRWSASANLAEESE